MRPLVTRRGRGAWLEGPNLSPLIDMTFILLIFFMVTASFVEESSLEIRRPVAASGAELHGRTVRVEVDRGGRVYLGGRPVRPWSLQARVRSFVAAGPTRVLVVADRDLDTQTLVDVVDQCRLAGATEVGVAVKRRGP